MDDGFSRSLAGQAFDQCRVTVVTSASAIPSAHEEVTTSVAMEGAVLLGDIVSRAAPESNVFVRIQLPTPATTSLPLLTLDADPCAAEYRGLLYDAKMTRFYAAALAAQPVDADDASGVRLWRLRDPQDEFVALKWPILDQHVLIERDFYADFLTNAKWLGALPKNGPRRQVAVVGQPGTGKSSFAVWLITMLLRGERTVVFSRNGAQRGAPVSIVNFVFHRGVVFRTYTPDLGAAFMLLSQPSVVHVYDSLGPGGETRCHDVLVTSPDPDIWLWFVTKSFATRCTFPLYSQDELLAWRKAEFGDQHPGPARSSVGNGPTHSMCTI